MEVDCPPQTLRIFPSLTKKVESHSTPSLGAGVVPDATSSLFRFPISVSRSPFSEDGS